MRLADRTVEAFHKGERVASRRQEPRPTGPRHSSRPHAQRPSPTRRLDPGADDRRRPPRSDRRAACANEAIMTDFTPPRAGLPHLHRHTGPGEDLRSDPHGSGLPARRPDQGQVRRLHPLHPSDRPRSRVPRPGAGTQAAQPRQHPWAHLLPLTCKETPMLAHPTHERLIALGLAGMARAFEEQRASPDILALSFEVAAVGIMADREAADLLRQPPHGDPSQVRRPAPERGARGHRPAHAARHRPGAARQRPVADDRDRPSRQPGDPRRHLNSRHNAHLAITLKSQDPFL